MLSQQSVIRRRNLKMNYLASYWPSGPISSQAGNRWLSFVLIIIVTATMLRKTHTCCSLSPPWSVPISYAGTQHVCVCVLIRRLPGLWVQWYSISLFLQYKESEWKKIHLLVGTSLTDFFTHQHKRLDDCWHMQLVHLNAWALSTGCHSFSKRGIL